MKLAALIIASGAVLICAAIMLILEKKNTDAKKMVIIAVMTALSVGGRLAFAAIPGFKPVTAIVIITGIYLGREAGFMCGAMTALVSNIYFGQGPWTPFQMLLWGGIGLVAALLSEKLLKHRWLLFLYGAISGVIFSLVMDVYTVIWMYNRFVVAGYVAAITAAVPYTIEYAVSNVLFLMVLTNPIGGKLKRFMIRCEKSHIE